MYLWDFRRRITYLGSHSVFGRVSPLVIYLDLLYSLGFDPMANVACDSPVGVSLERNALGNDALSILCAGVLVA